MPYMDLSTTNTVFRKQDSPMAALDTAGEQVGTGLVPEDRHLSFSRDS